MKENTPDVLKKRYIWIKEHSAKEISPGFALEIIAEDRIGLMADIAFKASTLGCNLNYIQSWIEYDGLTHILIQVVKDIESGPLEEAIRGISSVHKVTLCPTYRKTYGKRVIILGGGAQVASVAAGAIAEADRHNIRGETISVDTIAVVGEEEIAQAVRAVGRLHRVGLLVLAGALMGGQISRAVDEIRNMYGIPVISLKMAGSVNGHSDLVVTDPVAAGVMAVMAISHVGQFNLLELEGNVY